MSDASLPPPPPTNSLVSALLTDLYQLTMTYAHWKNNRHNDPAVFELFFRKNPFGGEYTILAGLDECLKYLAHFAFTDSDIDYVRTIPALANADEGFFTWLHSLDTSAVKVYAMQDGSVVFARVPLLIIEAPLGIGQLLETTLLTLLNYPSLIATNAARMVRAAQARAETHLPLPAQCSVAPRCIEFGLRRAQGPDGGFSASKYAYMGGFVGTSNVKAGKLCGLPLAGTHAHAFVQAYLDLSLVQDLTIAHAKTGETITLLPIVLQHRQRLAAEDAQYASTNDGELAAFCAYAVAFPRHCLCLIDTYDTLRSGLLNFCLVALALDDLGYQAVGIRLDSGDLGYLSMECARVFDQLAKQRPVFAKLSIVASNDINEAVLHAIAKEPHAITSYGIGTNLVTCEAQPALGCVYKLVEIDGRPRMKLSQELGKVLIPGRKKAYRLYGEDGRPILDVMVRASEQAPTVGQRILCRHPFDQIKRAAVTPSRVETLHKLVFDNGHVVPGANRSLEQARKAVEQGLSTIRPDILRYVNPTPYKVSVSDELFTFLHELWQSETPVAELH